MCCIWCKQRYYDIDVVEGDEESLKSSARETSIREIVPSDFQSEQTSSQDLGQDPPQSRPRVTFLDDETASNRFQDAELNRQISQYREAYGSSEGPSDLDFKIFRSLNYGPEQQAVYSREMAQGAAACCPNGCCEGRVRRQPIDRLLEMEEATIERLENAQYQLQCAQMQAAVSIVDKGDMKKGKSLDETELMLQTNTESAIRHSPSRPGTHGSVSTTSGEGVEFPTLEDLFSLSDDGSNNSVDVQPKCQDGTESLSSNGRNSISQADSNDLSQGSRGNGAGRLSALSANTALQPISEHTSERDLTSPTPKFGITSPNNSVYTQAMGGSFLRMTSEGRFLFNNNTMDFDDESSTASAINTNRFTNGSQPEITSPTETSLRRRTFTGQSFKTVRSDADQTKSSNQWEQVNNILRKDDVEGLERKNKKDIETGVWTMPTPKSAASTLKASFISHMKAIGRWTKSKTTNNPITQKLAKDSTYAVVTFSSRQAAVAARHCLADGRGVDRWLSLETVPVPPLADAAPCDMITCRGCCRPVTLNLNQNQLMLRRYV
jgi:hypothetical protein